MGEEHIGKIVFFCAIALIVGFFLGDFVGPLVSNHSRFQDSRQGFVVNQTLQNQISNVFSSQNLTLVKDFCFKENQNSFGCLSYCRSSQNTFCSSLFNSSGYFGGRQ